MSSASSPNLLAGPRREIGRKTDGSAVDGRGGPVDGAAGEPIFGCFAIMINESDWTRAPVPLRRGLWSAQVAL